MEIQLQELIEQIKKDGVAAAETQAAAILEAAQAQADKILADAKAQAERSVEQAQEENARLVRVSEDAIRQAGRNLLISFRDSVTKELDALVEAQVTAVYSADALTALIVQAVDAWAKKTDTDSLAVLLNSEDLHKLESGLQAALKERLLSGVTLKPNDDFAGGFRIAVDNGKAYYDYSTEAVTDMLSAYLNPRVTALLKEAEGV